MENIISIKSTLEINNNISIDSITEIKKSKKYKSESLRCIKYMNFGLFTLSYIEESTTLFR